jgi:sugar lactone lactonase YvrE
MRHLSIVGIFAIVLAAPLPVVASPMFYALGLNGTIYDVAANGATSPFLTGMGGDCMAADSSGNLYVNNAAWTLSKITPAGVVSTYSDDPGPLIHGPEGLAVDSSGNLYDTNPPDGAIGVIASGGGNPTAFASGLNYPWSLAVAPSGTVYASSWNGGLVYKISSGAGVSDFATGFSAPGTGSLAFDGSGNLYVADLGTISEITPGGDVSTFITSHVDSFGSLAFDSSGNLYATTQYDSIVEITPGPNPVVTTFATFPAGITALVADPVPEPASVVLFGLAAICLFLSCAHTRMKTFFRHRNHRQNHSTAIVPAVISTSRQGWASAARLPLIAPVKRNRAV